MDSRHFRAEEIADGVYGVYASDSGAAVSNAAIVDLGDKTVVFDTFLTLDAADDLERAVRELTGRGAFLVVNSHWHSDHVGGNQVFDGAPVAATARTLELILEDAPSDRAAFEAEIDGFLARARRLATEAAGPEGEARARTVLGTAEALDRSRGRFRLTLPNLVFESSLLVEGSDRSLELRSLGKGHTDSDTYALLPEDGIVISGDLLWVGLHPRTNDGHPAEWAGVIDQLAAHRPHMVIPGHGPTGMMADLRDMAAYLRAIDVLVAELVAEEASEIAEVAIPDVASHWSGPQRFTDGLSSLVARASGT